MSITLWVTGIQNGLSFVAAVSNPLSASQSPVPWEKVAADIFELMRTTYLLAVDYYSRYPER